MTPRGLVSPVAGLIGLLLAAPSVTAQTSRADSAKSYLERGGAWPDAASLICGSVGLLKRTPISPAAAQSAGVCRLMPRRPGARRKSDLGNSVAVCINISV